ncbi:MAG: glycosyltransferase [Candidatus Eisenbacteria bacterium]|nr:glycosyltransferase [Candidatus Eisenbacteria bacterium]
MPLVSVVIAAYKSRPDYLSTAIRSALDQTCSDLEILVSDDSPDDALGKVVEGCADARVRYRWNRTPLGAARNHWASFLEARGEYVAVLNHDDRFAPTFLERLVAPLQSHEELVLAFCDHWVIDEDGRILTEQTEKNSARWGRSRLTEGTHRPFFDLLIAQAVPMAAGAVFRRERLPAALPALAGPAYDLWMAYLLCREGLGAYYVRDRLCSWRAHSENLTSRGGFDWRLGAAECWATVAADPALVSVRGPARERAAFALSSCAAAAWRSGRRRECLSFGLRSFRMRPTWRGAFACLLPLLPKERVPRGAKPATGAGGDPEPPDEARAGSGSGR